MGLTFAGSLPVSAINIGLVAGIAALNVKIGDLQLVVTDFGVAAAAAVELGLNVPNLVSLTAGITTLVGDLEALIDPTKFSLNAGLEVGPKLGLELGLVEVSLGVVGPIAATFEAGLKSGSLAAWTYRGNAKGYGQKLAANTNNGWERVSAGTSVNAILIATESFDSWGQFSAGFNTGTSSTARVTSDLAILEYLGTLGAASLNTGVARLAKEIDLILLDLKGAKATLEAQIQVSLGIGLPSLPDVAVDPNIDIELLLSNLVDVNVDFAAEIGALNVSINATISLVVELGLQLSAGGLSVWFYDGPAGGMGTAFAAATSGGLPAANGPDAPVYGIVVATELPAVWANFGLIFGKEAA